MSWAEQQVAASGGAMSATEWGAVVASIMNAPGNGSS